MVHRFPEFRRTQSRQGHANGPGQPEHRGARVIDRFRSGEDGGLTIFSLFLLMCILIVGGFGVDFIRTEVKRAKLQAVADRAVLAAGSMTQDRDPETVVRGYFTAAGFDGDIVTVEIEDYLGSRAVSVAANERVDASYLRLLGIESFGASVISGAGEAITSAEVSLVLDVSGSMNGEKLENLKVAANQFLSTIFGASVESGTTVSIVPFSTQVNAGADILNQMTVTAEHDYSDCIDFVAEDFTTATISTTDLMQRTGHFDPFTGYNSTGDPQLLVCRTDEGSKVLPLSNNIAALNASINSMAAAGNTSADVGMKWGAALLDQSFVDVTQGLVFDGVVDAEFSDRPYAYENAEGLKVIVLMTDGANTTQYMLDESFGDELADVWLHPSGGLIFGDQEDGNQDGDGHLNEPYWFENDGKFHRETIINPQTVQLTFADLWDHRTIKRHAFLRSEVTGEWSDYEEWAGAPFTTVGTSTKNERLLSICSAAKTAGITIFTIGFEVDSAQISLLEDCATSPAHTFDVEGVDITTAFSAIASTMNQLRLTQ